MRVSRKSRKSRKSREPPEGRIHVDDALEPAFIPQTIIDEVSAHALMDYPMMAAGLITGDDAEPFRTVHRCVNIQQRKFEEGASSLDEADGFWMSPAEVERVADEARDRGERITSIYHPNLDLAARACMSKIDRLTDDLWNVSWLILAVNNGVVHDAGLFSRRPGESRYSGRRVRERYDHPPELAVELRPVLSRLNTELMRAIKRDPDILKRLDGHVFERFVAEILSSMGFTVDLNVRTVAGEIDIIAFSMDRLASRVGYVIECKRYVERKRVNSQAALRLLGVKDELSRNLGIDRALLATTSDFTSPVYELSRKRWDLSLRNHDALLDWITWYKPKDRLYLPPGHFD